MDEDTVRDELADVMLEPIDWNKARSSSSWQRANPMDADVEEYDDGYASVQITRDGGDVHAVKLVETDGEAYAKCDCKGFVYNDRCAHIVALHRTRTHNAEDDEQGEQEAVRSV